MTETAESSELMIERLFAPGTRLREAVELIQRQDTGALVVLGSRRQVAGICTGGFDLDSAEFTPQRLAELSKMDGAIVVDAAGEYILKANVHLIPDSTISTDETGTRQRTAERTARQTGLAVLSISEERSTVTVYTGERRYELQSPTTLLAAANQSIQSLERFRRRLGEAADQLTRAEVEDVATYRDVVLPLQRAALVRRIGKDLERYAVELGKDGDLIQLQLIDLLEDVDAIADHVYQDYAKRRTTKTGRLAGLDNLPTDELYDPVRVGAEFGFVPLDTPARPRGIRAVAGVHRLPEAIKDSLAGHFGDFQKMLHASAADFDQVEGVGRARAQLLHHHFEQLLDSSPLWQLGED